MAMDVNPPVLVRITGGDPMGSTSEKTVFHGLHSLVDAIEHHKKVVEVKAAEVEPPTEYQLQTQELRMLAQGAQLLEGQKIGIGYHPIMFHKSYISDVLSPIYSKYGMQIDWVYNQYRICKNARLLGVKEEIAIQVHEAISGIEATDPDVITFMDYLKNSDEYRDWTFVGKPTKRDKVVYWMLCPKEVAHQTAAFHISTWEFLE
jgi:hypothetical protein